MTRQRELELIASAVDALRVSHELSQALASTRDEARAGRDVSVDVELCVDVARRLLAATLRLQELVPKGERGVA
jgi:hypothetical protein